jgi:polysaccharide export outer membrane protein
MSAAAALGALAVSMTAAPAFAQANPSAQASRPVAPATNGAAARPVPAGVELPPEYVIGPEDVLYVHFWRDADMTVDNVTVRPDGRISLPLVNDIVAAGLTPEALKTEIEKVARKLQQDPSVTVVVRQINSRKVFITGSVATPGPHQLTGPRTVMQLIALAGGLTEYADKKNITVLRVENGKTRSFKFNYSDVAKGHKLEQNIVLKPGDTVIVP